MNQYVTGLMIKELREKKKMTQKELAEKLSVSDKTVSKWERGQGYPDITLLEPIAKSFSISIAELISGVAVNNTNKAANMMKSKFYDCPVCGNVIHSIGDVDIHCHGIKLEPELAEEADENHKIQIEKIEDEYYVKIENEMSKNHYISFIAAVSDAKIEIEKLYPEQEPQARFKINRVRRILFYCNSDGLFYKDIKFNRK